DRPVRGKWVTDPPALAGNARGDAIVAWSRYGPEEDGFGCEKCDDVIARVRRDGRPFGPRVVVARRQTMRDLRVAMNARGDAVVAWTDATADRVHARYLTDQDRWKKVDTVPDPARRGYLGDSATDFAAAIGPEGQVVLAWASTAEPGDINSDPFPQPVYAAVRPRDGRLGKGIELADNTAQPHGAAAAVGHLDAAITTRGEVLVAFTDQVADGPPRVRAAILAGDTVVADRTLSTDPKRGGELVDVAPGRRGEALVLWATTRYSEGFLATGLQATLLRGRTYGPTHQVTSPADRAEVGDAVAAIDPAGRRAHAMWLRYGGRDGNGSRVLTSSRAIP
ncbi:MAG: hypothetical protein M3340_07560, partial [Actinomycetota bacterium]|nr:hypothetical protein [Actinomycetota bacterium]